MPTLTENVGLPVLVDALRDAWRRRALVGAIAALGALTAAGVAALAPQGYEAEAVLVVTRSKLPNGQAPAWRPLNFYEQLALQPDVARRAAESAAAATGADVSSLLGEIQRSLDVFADLKSELLRVRVRTSDPKGAAAAANALADEVVATVDRVNGGEQEGQRAWVAEKLREAERRLQAASAAVAEFERTTQLPGIAAELDARVKLRGSYQSVIATAAVEHTALDASARSADEALHDSEPTLRVRRLVGDDAAVAAKVGNPGRGLVAEVVNRAWTALMTERDQRRVLAAHEQARQASAESMLAENDKSIAALQQKAAELRERRGALDEEQRAARESYRYFSARLDEATHFAGAQKKEIALLTSASAPHRPASGRVPLHAAAGLSLGLVVGLAVVLAQERLGRAGRPG